MSVVMAAEGDDRDGGPADPRALRHVGPATAAVLEGAPIDAADIVARRVSHRHLIEAGVNPGVAERLRREYGLLWAFRWHPGDVDLDRRAAALPDAGPAERRWIAASADAWRERSYEPSADPDEPERPTDVGGEWAAWPEPTGDDPHAAGLAATVDDDGAASCPRCGGDLGRYTLGERASVLCDDCGYAGVPVTREDAWRKAVDRMVRGEATPSPE